MAVVEEEVEEAPPAVDSKSIESRVCIFLVLALSPL